MTTRNLYNPERYPDESFKGYKERRARANKRSIGAWWVTQDTQHHATEERRQFKKLRREGLAHAAASALGFGA